MFIMYTSTTSIGWETYIPMIESCGDKYECGMQESVEIGCEEKEVSWTVWPGSEGELKDVC